MVRCLSLMKLPIINQQRTIGGRNIDIEADGPLFWLSKEHALRGAEQTPKQFY